MVLVPAVILLQDNIGFRIVLLELADKIPDFHFFFLPDLIHAKVLALHFFSSYPAMMQKSCNGLTT